MHPHKALEKISTTKFFISIPRLCYSSTSQGAIIIHGYFRPNEKGRNNSAES